MAQSHREFTGARTDGTKELIAVEDGYRESAESWKTVLRDLKRRGIRAPMVAVGDGALGFCERRSARCVRAGRHAADGSRAVALRVPPREHRRSRAISLGLRQRIPVITNAQIARL
jgi:hypothetical protein